MNLNVDVERINDVNFGRRCGTIDIDIPDYECSAILEAMLISSILEWISDESVIELFKDRNLTLEE